MYFHYDRAFGIAEPPSAYEWLLLDAMLGYQTLFPRSDWIYKAWFIVDPIMQHWKSEPPDDLPNYRQAPGAPWQRIPCIPIHQCKRASTATSNLE
jgi:glucose-6-phosphate 1-dehydrogenase